jgi:hypothetical protein
MSGRNQKEEGRIECIGSIKASIEDSVNPHSLLMGIIGPCTNLIYINLNTVNIWGVVYQIMRKKIEQPNFVKRGVVPRSQVSSAFFQTLNRERNGLVVLASKANSGVTIGHKGKPLM